MKHSAARLFATTAIVCLPLTVFAAPLLSEVAQWKDSDFEEGVLDTVVAENARYFVIRQDGGSGCPAGYMTLADKIKKTAHQVDVGTCSEFVKAEISKDALTFKVGKKITARYPLF